MKKILTSLILTSMLVIAGDGCPKPVTVALPKYSDFRPVDHIELNGKFVNNNSGEMTISYNSFMELVEILDKHSYNEKLLLNDISAILQAVKAADIHNAKVAECMKNFY